MKLVTIQITLIVLTAITCFLFGISYQRANEREQIPEDAVKLWETIQEVCVQNDLTPTIKSDKGDNGNLFFYITCVK